MPRPHQVCAAFVLTTMVAGCAARTKPPSTWPAAEAPNYRLLENGVATANVITPAAVPKLAAAGFKTIIDLRAPSERGVPEETAAAEHAGIRYLNLPVALATLNAAQVRQVAAALDDPANRPALLHCASGNRVGAVIALYREQIHGVSHEAALAEARASGLQAPEAIAAVERVRREMESAR
ncbi:MAG: blh 4 [Deltaproteobacteria bacterium]|jgi:uncharacterized protein (TIGR01244 family)|nr:blh 4 [Deltaproteobacteria bacterium]